MYPYVPRAQALAAAPGRDDLAGLKALDAADPMGPAGAGGAERVGCTGAVVARSGPRSAPAGAVCATALLLAALVIARSKRSGRHAAAGCTMIAGAVLAYPAGSRGGGDDPDDRPHGRRCARRRGHRGQDHLDEGDSSPPRSRSCRRTAPGLAAAQGRVRSSGAVL